VASGSYQRRKEAAQRAGFSSPYQQRIANARARAQAAGRTFSLREARGHGQETVTSLSRRTDTEPYTDAQGQEHDPIADARAHGYSWGEIEELLRNKLDIMRSPDRIARGKAAWASRDLMLDPSFYWYHAQ
jgi:hypothetical protein